MHLAKGESIHNIALVQLVFCAQDEELEEARSDLPMVPLLGGDCLRIGCLLIVDDLVSPSDTLMRKGLRIADAWARSIRLKWNIGQYKPVDPLLSATILLLHK